MTHNQGSSTKSVINHSRLTKYRLEEQYPGQIFNKYFVHEKRRTNYQVFVGSHAPPADMGIPGDIGVKTTHAEEVIDILTRQKKIQKPKNYEKHHVYYRTNSHGWAPADKGRKANNIPRTTHPEKGTAFALEVYSFTWRNVTNYYSNNNRKIFVQLDSTPRDREAVELSIGTGNGI